MKKIWSVLLIVSSVLEVFLGAYCLFSPGAALASVIYLLGFGLLFHGVSVLVYYFCGGKEFLGSRWVLIDGIVSTVFGAILLFSKAFNIAEALLPLLFCLWAIAKGIFFMIASSDLKKLHIEKAKYINILGILMLIFGIMGLYKPVVSVMAICVIVGLYFIFSGVIGILEWGVAERLSKL